MTTREDAFNPQYVDSRDTKIAELTNYAAGLEAKLVDKEKELEEMRGITQDILFAAAKLVNKNGR